MTTDLLKRLSFYTKASASFLVGLVVFNFITFLGAREYGQLIAYAIIISAVVFVPIPGNSYNYSKWDISLITAISYSILVQYNNLAKFHGISFTTMSAVCVIVTGMIAGRAKYEVVYSYSKVDNEELKFSVGDEESGGNDKEKEISDKEQ